MYALGATGGPHSRVELLRSEDGGAHFTFVSVPPVPKGYGYDNIGQLSFGTAEEGFLSLFRDVDKSRVLGLVLVTDDGGRSWTRARLPARDSSTPWARGVTIEGPVEASGGRVYLIGIRCTSAGDCPHYRLYRATGWLAKWVSSPGPESGTFNAGGGIDLAGFGSDVWMTVGNGVGPLRLLGSENGGRSFRVLSSPAGVSCSPMPTGPAVIWLTCPGGMLIAYDRSSDGGSHFVRLPITGVGTVAPSTELWAVSNDLAFFRGVHGFYRSADGGKRFVKLRRLPRAFGQNGAAVAALSFGTSRDGLALAGGELFRTSDGGLQWLQERAPFRGSR